MHLGALIFETHGESELVPENLDGEYWTDRKTTGTIVLSEKNEKLYTRFSDAQNVFR